MRVVLAVLFVLAVSVPSVAQSILTEGQPLQLAWDAGSSQPAEEKYKIRMLSQVSPAGVAITEIVTPTAATSFTVPYSTMPDVPFWVSVRAVRTLNTPGESGDSNVIGSFIKPSLKPPVGLRRVVP